jgi:hypothetical protein
MTSAQAVLTPHLLTLLFIFWSLFAIPASLILKRLGHHPAWALLIYFPPLAMIGMWVLALSPPPKSGGTA